MPLQGRDINLDINRVVAYRHWCNKLWNAIRFAVLNLGPDFVPSGRLEDPTFGCQWILSCLTGAVQATDAALEAYEFSAATTVSLAHFVCRALCTGVSLHHACGASLLCVCSSGRVLV